MTIQDANYELKKIKDTITILEKYRPNETIGTLPSDIIAQIKSIKVINPITSAGFERIETVLKNLHFAKYALENNIKEYYTQTSQPKSQAEPKKEVTIKKIDIQDKLNKPKIEKKPAIWPQPKSKMQKKDIESSWQQNVVSQSKNGPSPKSSLKS